MRLQTTFFTLILALALPSLAAADQQSGQSEPRPPITLQKGNKGGHVKRPKTPDRQSITCTYDGMNMDLNFTVSEGEATVNFDDSNTPLVYNWTMPCLRDSDHYSPTPYKIISPRYGFFH